MRGVADAPGMKKGVRLSDVEALIREIQRYLSLVDAVRATPPAPPAEREGGKEDA